MTQDEMDMFAQFEAQFDEPDLEDAIDLSKLTDLEISTMFSDVRRDLLASEQMMNPTTERGRELHSQRAALLIEMSRRGMR